MFTAEGLLRRRLFVGGTVELLVFREAGEGRVGLVAEVALISRRRFFRPLPRGPGTTTSYAAGRRQILRRRRWLRVHRALADGVYRVDRVDGASGRSRRKTAIRVRHVHRARLRKSR